MILVRMLAPVISILGMLISPTPAPQLKFVDNNQQPTIQVSEAMSKKEARPTRLVIDTIAVKAGIEAVGLNEEGATNVPEENNKVSWYKSGAKPGEIGSAVLAGHLEWGGQDGVFKRLPELNINDVIKIEEENGTVLQFKVVRTEIYDVDKFPLEEVYGKKDGKKLNLITCFGDYDKSRGDYPQRWVAYAEKIGS